MPITKDGDYLRKIGDKLRQLRVEQNKKQETVAGDLSIRQETLSKYENEGLDSLTALLKIADYYKVDINEILPSNNSQVNNFYGTSNGSAGIIHNPQYYLSQTDQNLLQQLIKEAVKEELKKSDTGS